MIENIDIELLNLELTKFIFSSKLLIVSYIGLWDDKFETRLAKILINWKYTQKAPLINNNFNFNGLHSNNNIIEINKLLYYINSFFKSFNNTNNNIINITNLLNNIGLKNLLIIIGMQNTIGSVIMLPPSRQICIQSFCKQNKVNSFLSKGARELSKHINRCSSKWWGTDLSGTEMQKNKKALDILIYILDNTVWINIIHISHNIISFELREINGYGARWSSDGTFFRGFVEPPMINGHELKWKH